MNRVAIHTTLSRECRKWLMDESTKTGKFEGEIIEAALIFYRNKSSLLEEYEQARIFLRELIKKELLDDYAKARPLLKRLIKEEITENNNAAIK